MKKIILIIVGIFLLTGCDIFGLSNEGKAKAKDYESIGKEMAIDFISKKYGFTPTVIDAEADTDRIDLGPLFVTGDVFVTMKYEGKTFYVKVPVENKYEKEIEDNYQNDIIEADIIKELESIFNAKLVLFISYLTDSTSKKGLQYYHDYYDGSNLIDFVPTFKAGVVNVPSLDKDRQDKLRDFSNDEFIIYNYKSEDDFKNSSKVKKNLIELPSFKTSEAIYLKELYVRQLYDINNLSRYTVNINKSDIVVGNESVIDNNIYNVNYSLKKLSSDDLDYVFRHSSKKPSIVLNAISLKDENVGFIYISNDYYEKNKVSRAIYYCKTSKLTEDYDFKLVGDYYYANYVNISNCADGYILLIKD